MRINTIRVAIVLLFGFSGAVQAEKPAFDPLFPLVGKVAGTPYPYPVDIARDPNDVPKHPLPNGAKIVITAHEIEAYISPKDNARKWAGDGSDVKFRYFAFGGGHPTQDPAPKVPGPFIRVRAGDTITVVLDNTNAKKAHSIDFHSVVGLKGGATVLVAEPGGTAQLTLTMRNPGTYVYHCAAKGTPFGIAQHMNNGMFGIVLVEPRDPYHPFNRRVYNATEFYVFQQDLFIGEPDASGVAGFGESKMVKTLVPDYSVYNGRVGSLIDYPMLAKSGSPAVIYHGASGVHIPSPHMIGEIWDAVYSQGDILSKPLRNIDSSLVPTAGTAVYVMRGDRLVPTDLSNGLGPELDVMIDHSFAHFRLGALGLMLVDYNLK